MKKAILAIALTILTLPNHLLNGQARYPIQQVIGSDTVVVSTISQIKTALKWKSDFHFCEQELSIIYDSIIPLYKLQIVKMDSIIKNADSISSLEKQKFTIADSSYKATLIELSSANDKIKKQKAIRNFFIGLSAALTILIFIK